MPNVGASPWPIRLINNLFKAATYFYRPAEFVDASLSGLDIYKVHSDLERAYFNHAMNVVNIGAGYTEHLAHVPGVTIEGNEKKYIWHCQVVYAEALSESVLGYPEFVIGNAWDEIEPHHQLEIWKGMTTWDNRVYKYLFGSGARNAGYTAYKILLWEVKLNETQPFNNFYK